jgi:hypothetical protein
MRRVVIALLVGMAMMGCADVHVIPFVAPEGMEGGLHTDMASTLDESPPPIPDLASERSSMPSGLRSRE